MASVAHEGNPRVNSLAITGTLDGDVFLLPLLGDGAPQAGPAEADVGPAANSECPDCEAFEFSVYDQDAIDQCTSPEGDGVATVQDDCPTVEDCIDFCSDYYGDFNFGLTCTTNGGQDSIPFYWQSTPLYSCPAGWVTCNSSCAPAVISREISFDTTFFETEAEGADVEVSVTPVTALHILESKQATNASELSGKHVYQRAVCDTDIDCTTGASCAEEPLNNGLGLDVRGIFVQETNKPIVALAILTDDGTGATITGYGLLIDRDQGIAATVSWSSAAHEDYTVLDSAAYTPAEDDPWNVNVTLTCEDDEGAEDTESLTIIPNWGRVKAVAGFSGAGQYVFSSEHNVVTRAQFETFTHAALIVLPNFNNQECSNTVRIRRICTLFQRESE